MLTILEHFATYDLLYAGDCKLLGVTDNGDIYVEELYGDDDWLAQHHILTNEGIVETVDEAEGNNLNIKVFELPEGLIQPRAKPCCPQLQFSGARLRGLRADERIAELVQPLSIEDKIELTEFMEWDIEPLQLIGIAESVILSHTKVSEKSTIVCRRVRIAYQLAKPEVTHDYDSMDVYLLHEYQPEDDPMPELVDCLNDIDDVVLLRPMDCLFHMGRLYVADGGEDDDVSAIHIFQLPIQSENS